MIGPFLFSRREQATSSLSGPEPGAGVRNIETRLTQRFLVFSIRVHVCLPPCDALVNRHLPVRHLRPLRCRDMAIVMDTCVTAVTPCASSVYGARWRDYLRCLKSNPGLKIRFVSLSVSSRQLKYRRFGSATDAISLPQPKPWAMRKGFIVPSIGSREVVRAERSSVRD
jgi:hypothetical protein